MAKWIRVRGYFGAFSVGGMSEECGRHVGGVWEGCGRGMGGRRVGRGGWVGKWAGAARQRPPHEVGGRPEAARAGEVGRVGGGWGAGAVAVGGGLMAAEVLRGGAMKPPKGRGRGQRGQCRRGRQATRRGVPAGRGRCRLGGGGVAARAGRFQRGGIGQGAGVRCHDDATEKRAGGRDAGGTKGGDRGCPRRHAGVAKSDHNVAFKHAVLKCLLCQSPAGADFWTPEGGGGRDARVREVVVERDYAGFASG